MQTSCVTFAAVNLNHGLLRHQNIQAGPNLLNLRAICMYSDNSSPPCNYICRFEQKKAETKSVQGNAQSASAKLDQSLTQTINSTPQ